MPLEVEDGKELRNLVERLEETIAEKTETPEGNAAAIKLANINADKALIKPAIESAISKILNIKAWPSEDFAPYTIELGLEQEVITLWGPQSAQGRGLGRSIVINPAKPLRIVLGIQLLSSPALLHYANAIGAAVDDIIMFFLLHETFHLREADNLSKCMVPFGSTGSGFARAAHPEFSSAWRQAMLALAVEFPSQGLDTQKRNTLAIWKSSDIACEAAADLLALKHMEKAGVNIADWIMAAITLRKMEEQAASSIQPDRNNQVGVKPPYQIGTVIDKHAAALISKDEWSIREAMWREAFNVALTENMFLPNDVKSKINAALSTSPRPQLDADQHGKIRKIISKLRGK